MDSTTALVPDTVRLYPPTEMTEAVVMVTSLAPAKLTSGNARDVIIVNNCFFMYKPLKRLS